MKIFKNYLNVLLVVCLLNPLQVFGNSIIAVVNDEVITLNELENLQTSEEKNIVIEQLINRKLLINYSIENNINIPGELYRLNVENFLKSKGIKKIEEKALKKVEKIIRQELLIELAKKSIFQKHSDKNLNQSFDFDYVINQWIKKNRDIAYIKIFKEKIN